MMVSSKADIFRLSDVWKQLHTIFEGKPKNHPEIYLINMTDDEMAACLIYLMRYSRGVQSRFVMAGTRVIVDVSSPERAIRAIIGGAVSAAMWIELPGMPPIGIYIDEPDMLTISYIPGQWNAQTVVAFFDLLQQLVTIAPSAEVVPDSYKFTFDEQTAFMEIWREFQRAAPA
jgi:hypothetical protein